MEFERWNNQEDYNKLMDWFNAKAGEPKNYQKYENAVREALTDFREVFGLEREVSFVIAETDIGFLEDKYDEVPDWSYSQGFSASPEWHDLEKPTVFVMANDNYEYWKDLLKFVTAHELAHQKFYENHEIGWQIYQKMMFEGHAMHSAEQIAEEKDYNWLKHEQKTRKIDKEELLAELDKYNTWAGENKEPTSTLFVPGGEKWQNAEGYPIAFQITEDILERTERDINDLLEMSFEEWREETEKSINRYY